jgi:hypothetical protein
MKVSTLTYTRGGATAISPVGLLHTLFSFFLAAAQRGLHQVFARGKSTISSMDRTAPQRADACVMLVESDIKRDMHNILP